VVRKGDVLTITLTSGKQDRKKNPVPSQEQTPPPETSLLDNIGKSLRRIFTGKKSRFLSGAVIVASLCGLFFWNDIKGLKKNRTGNDPGHEFFIPIVITNRAGDTLKIGEDFYTSPDSANENTVKYRSDTVLIDKKMLKKGFTLLINKPDTVDSSIWLYQEDSIVISKSAIAISNSTVLDTLNWNKEKKEMLDSICRALEGVDFTNENLTAYAVFLEKDSLFAQKVLTNDSVIILNERINALKDFFKAAFAIKDSKESNQTNDQEVFKKLQYLFGEQKKRIESYKPQDGPFRLSEIRTSIIEKKKDKTQTFREIFNKETKTEEEDIILRPTLN
jgi:hypothetical protein